MDKFTDIVLSWSPHQILDDSLYSNQVENIPESFETVDQYLGSYVFPLLEETRSELVSAMETVHKAPFAEITSIRESKRQKLVYSVKVDSWRNDASNLGKEPYQTMPGDVFLLSDMKPQSDSDLQRAGNVFMFACPRDVVEGEGICAFKLRTSEPIVEAEVAHEVGKPFYIVYLMNLTTHNRIWSALAMRKNLMIIEKVLTKNDMDTRPCEFCPIKCSTEMEEKWDLFSELNEPQLRAVLASLSKAECSHSSSVELIWGPPGTGKTMTLIILLYILLTMEVRTIVCAPTNLAISELALRVIGLVRNNSLKTESENISSPCSLGDMLIFGNRDNLKVGSDLEEIFLDDRVVRLGGCLTGWKNSAVSMLGFLDGCISLYHLFANDVISKSISLLEFSRDQFSKLAAPLRNHMLTMITHLPRSVSLQGIELISLLESIQAVLFESSMSSEKLENIFLQQGTFAFEPLVGIKSKCAATLRSLHAHVDKLGHPNIGTSRTPIEEFCFQKASLIFCTTSSSFKLHSINTKTFSVLVIDEAAQVRECESIIALQLPGVRHAILFGDEKQLPAVVKSKMCEALGFGRSLFERLSLLGNSKHLLDVQYRMHPSISRFPNSNFYLNQILDAPCVQSRGHRSHFLQGRMFGPYSFINVRGGKEELDGIGHSKINMVEVGVVVTLVQKLLEAWNGTGEKLSIGVISPYAAQVATIQHILEQKYKDIKGFIVSVKSVDGFQGGEEDIIILSTVRSHSGGSMGFLASPQRTNVALTRARHCMWILGNERALSRSDSIWEALICDAKHRSCFFIADDDLEIRETIVKVKSKLGQLEDLFSEESLLFKNSVWKVSFSDRFRKSFQTQMPSNVKMLATGLLVKLASGWRPKKVNVDWMCQKSSYVVKQFKVDSYYIVCSVGIIGGSVYEQILKVWDILPMTETSQLLKRLDSMASTYTSVFIEHCNEKLLEGNLEIPKSWSISDDIIPYKDKNDVKSSAGTSDAVVERQGNVERSEVSENLLLMKFYSLSTCAVNRLLTDHEVTDEQRRIIMFPESSFILGRSGTGKTTILTMKLIQKFQQYCIASRDSICESGETILHQLFVTVSPKLCHAVKKYVSELKSFSCEYLSGMRNIIDSDDVEETTEFKDIPDTFEGIQPEKYPLIITFRKFLMMLDGTLGTSYFQRFCYARGSGGSSSVALESFIRNNEVTYDRFQHLYWPRFNAKLTKSFDPSRVFTEIMSHIKGGPHGGHSKISRRDYVSISNSRASTLIDQQREVVYDIFELYEKMKLDRGDFDLADFVIDIHLRLNKENMLGDMIDFVYIDEVQDLSMKQISLFKYICRNSDEGFVFSGDTAQTIARGIDFRFQDIRCLFYNEFLMKPIKSDIQERRGKGLISTTFCLSENFRTHTGVLRLAQSVIDIISHFFPHSIDVLPPEKSHKCGKPPVLLEPGCGEYNSILTIFGQSENAGGNWLGFGADQVILVRDDSASREVSKCIGNRALILTILQSKGLEFQDVLLYNFFGSSPLSNEWRVVYDFLKEKDLLGTDSPKSVPRFSQTKHNLLCSELKQLYVAITRTRQNLWIYEDSEDICKPMLDYWRRLCLVEVRKVDGSIAKEMQRVASSPEEWKSQGIKKNYKMAMMCFKKSGEETWEKRAKASQLRDVADTLRGSDSREARTLLREAGEIFESINRADSAAECFYDSGEYERAGRIYLALSELRKAGECFSLAGNHKTAAEVYDKGYLFQECLSSCFRGNHFDLGLQFIDKWRQQASSNSQNMEGYKETVKISQEYLEKCALEYFRAKDSASLLKFVRSFHTVETKRHFLKSLGCLDELITLEEEMGNINEAAEIAKHAGYILRAVDLLEKLKQFEDASLLILSYVLFNSVWVSGSQGWPLKAFPQKQELLTKTVSFAQKVSGTLHDTVCLEARLLSHDQASLSELVKCYRDSKVYGNYTGEVLSVRKLLEAHFEVRVADYEWDREPNIVLSCFDERMSRARVSSGTLVYVWDLLQVHNLEVLKCLPSLKTVDFTTSECTLFCLNYFGVRALPHKQSLTYILMNPEAAWLKYVDKGNILGTHRGISTLKAHSFVSAAQKYWGQELISCGLRVLGLLEKLYRANSSAKYYQNMCLTYMFEISRFLNSKSLHVNRADVRMLHGFLQYFEIVFPLYTRQSLSDNKSMMSLRKTKMWRNVLEDVISRNISGRGELTCGQIGRVLMIILGSGPPEHGLYERIAGRLKWSSWNSFVQKLKSSSSDHVALSHELHQALAGTYYDANWRARKDYISPSCFFYLVERLMIMAPHSWGLFFSTKSSFAEYLTSLPSDADPSAGLVMDQISHPTRIGDFTSDAESLTSLPSDANPSAGLVMDQRSQPTRIGDFTSDAESLTSLPSDANPSAGLVMDQRSQPTCIGDITSDVENLTPLPSDADQSEGPVMDWRSHLTSIDDFAFNISQECLLKRHDTAEWINNSGIDCEYYFPVLMLRLVVIMCLSCLNSELSFEVILELLDEHDIRSQLPVNFCEAIGRFRRDDTFSYVDVVAQAFKAVGDPLLVLTTSRDSVKFSCQDAVVLDVGSFSRKTEIIGTLFSNRTGAKH